MANRLIPDTSTPSIHFIALRDDAPVAIDKDEAGLAGSWVQTLGNVPTGTSYTSLTFSDLAAINSAHSAGGLIALDATTGLHRLDLPSGVAVSSTGDGVHLKLSATDSTLVFVIPPITIDAAVKTRLAPATAGRDLVVDASGNADARLANNVVHGGNGATLYLRSTTSTGALKIENGNEGSAIEIIGGTGAFGHGIRLTSGCDAISVSADNDGISLVAQNNALRIQGLAAVLGTELEQALVDAQKVAPSAGSPAAGSLHGKVDTLLTRITSTLFSGITSLASWLGILAGKTADPSTLAEINATTAGAGYDNTTQSLEAQSEAIAALDSGGSGEGIYSVSLTIKQADLTIVPNADITLTLDNASAQSSVHLKQQANTNGVVTFNLNPGTYYIWREKSGVLFSDPATLTVASDGSATIS